MSGPSPSMTLVQIQTSSILAENQVRSTLDPEKVARLAASMKELGQQVPIRLRRTAKGQFVVVDGHYRLAAALFLGWREILATIEEAPMASAEVEKAQLASFVRFDLNPMEHARAYDRQLRESGMTAAKLAAITGVSEATISRTRSLIGTKPEVQELVIAGKLGPSLAVPLSLIGDPDRYAVLLERARAGALTRAEIQQAHKPVKRSRRAVKSKRSAPRVVELGKGCSLKLGSAVRSVGELVELLAVFIESARRFRDEADDDLAALGRLKNSADC